jgi:hypothetical protein
MLSGPSGPGQKDWMTFTFKLERLDGAPAEPATIKVTRGGLGWGPGVRISTRAPRP